MTGHTKEPWAYRPDADDDWGIIRAPVTEQGQWIGGVICQARDPEALDPATLGKHREAKTDPWEANARRIVTCVNAMQGIPDPAAFVAAFEGMREALEWALAELNGLTRYNNDTQRENCFALADAALQSARIARGDA